MLKKYISRPDSLQPSCLLEARASNEAIEELCAVELTAQTLLGEFENVDLMTDIVPLPSVTRTQTVEDIHLTTNPVKTISGSTGSSRHYEKRD